jgi:ACT domain-containing protein
MNGGGDDFGQDDESGDDDPHPDGGQVATTHTVRLELPDEPGQLLAALRPIAEAGGNFRSVHHERGDRTPRGQIPVEIDLECHPDRFEDVLAGLRASDVTVSSADEERYRDAVTVLLVGHLVDTDLSDTLARIETCEAVSVSDVSLDAPQGTDEASSARLGLAVAAERTDEVLGVVREVAAEKDLRVVEPLVGGGR